MTKETSCCGMICAECEFVLEECSGCHQSQGQPFWIHFTQKPVCDIYNCCVEVNHYRHCGSCDKLPCAKYTENEADLTMSSEDALTVLQMQLAQLAKLTEEEKLAAK